MGFRWDTRAALLRPGIGQLSKITDVFTDQPLPCPSGMCASFPHARPSTFNARCWARPILSE